ncbi:hypothetical protein ABK040_011526 [Willaertia magna]
MAQTTPKLFTPLTLGPYEENNESGFKLSRIQLSHRVVMAPLTRCRALVGDCELTSHAITYYEQRATEGGLIITEASQINGQSAQGYPCTPGIYSKEQIEVWKKVTDAVHKKGGIICLQMWHVGRARYKNSVSSSDIGLTGEMTDLETMQRVKCEKPKALTTEEIKEIVKSYGQATKNAIEAGFDMVEIHAANGYLINQFIVDGVNKRTDEYGGSIENRLRFMKEVVEECINAFGGESHRVGIRLSPSTTFLEVSDSNPNTTYAEAVKELSKYKLGYLHLVEPRVSGGLEETKNDPVVVTKELRVLYNNGPIISAGGFKREEAINTVEEGTADMIAFGRYFISNPDLVFRLKENLPLTPYNRSTFYGSKDIVTGYTDYECYRQ